MSPLRILLVDDHPVVREGLRWMLAGEPDICIVAEADSLDATLATLGAHEVDVMLLDLDLGDDDGLDVLRALREHGPQVPAVVLTMHDDPEHVESAVRAGARGYLLKDAPQPELVRAIIAAAAGGAYLQPEVTYPLLQKFARDVRAEGAVPHLTAREIEVIALAARGESNRQIAATIGLAQATVKEHLHNVYAKLGAADRAHAVAIALRNRVIP
jgi:DNA-binding NarL/FixJ family response regulator